MVAMAVSKVGQDLLGTSQNEQKCPYIKEVHDQDEDGDEDMEDDEEDSEEEEGDEEEDDKG